MRGMLSANAQEHELDYLCLAIGLVSLERYCHQAHSPDSQGDFGSGPDGRARVEDQLHCGYRGRYDALAVAVTNAERPKVLRTQHRNRFLAGSLGPVRPEAPGPAIRSCTLSSRIPRT